MGLTRTFQIVKPFPHITVIDNVMVGAFNHTRDRKVALERASEVLDFLEMNEISGSMAGGIPIASRKRLELARVLATEPKMVLLDETMAGLRPTETEEMIDFVRKIRDRGISLLIVEHVMKVIMSLADRIVVIHHGEKISEGTPETVVRDQAVIDAYLGEVQSNARS
jgi:branched-chain amino acid transport system ATP-binding protein